MRLISGIKPTGVANIGHYLGAFKNWIALQNKYESLFFIADYHAMTVPYEIKEMSRQTLELAIDLIACGINPEKATLFVQSHLAEHTELAWILSNVTALGDLRRMTQFKEKSKECPEAVNAGLFNYPILMAADILLYKAEIVPVGEDQLQHLELTREIARRFNKRFGQTFPEPKAILTKTPRVMSLVDPTKKMSKSDDPNSYIALTDSKETIWKKLSTAVTDPARKRKIDPGTPAKCNIYQLHKNFSSNLELKKITEGCQKAKIGCLECKRKLAENIFKQLRPIQEKRKKLEENPEKIKKILANGSKKAKKIAEKNMTEIKEKVGLLSLK